MVAQLRGIQWFKDHYGIITHNQSNPQQHKVILTAFNDVLEWLGFNYEKDYLDELERLESKIFERAT